MYLTGRVDFLLFGGKWIQQTSAELYVMDGKDAALVSAVNTLKMVQRETATPSKRDESILVWWDSPIPD